MVAKTALLPHALYMLAQGGGVRTYDRKKVVLNKVLFERIRPIRDDGSRRNVAAKTEAATACQ